MSTRRPLKPKTRQNSPAKNTAGGHYVRRDRAGRFVSGRRASGHYEHVSLPERRTVDVSDYLDAREIDRRLADPSNQRRLTLAELRAKRDL
jgi:hypothetical protein